MIVKNILVGKRGNVVTIEPSADLTAAIKLLAEQRIGAVVILGADHRIVGILSERDIVRVLAEHGRTVLNEPVSQVMTRDVKTCSERRHYRKLDGAHDDGKIPPYASGRAREAHRHRVDWRRGQKPRRGDRTRSRSATRLCPPVILPVCSEPANLRSLVAMPHLSPGVISRRPNNFIVQG